MNVKITSAFAFKVEILCFALKKMNICLKITLDQSSNFESKVHNNKRKIGFAGTIMLTRISV